jgi:acetyl-CoA carboxylase biotin carboxyl carrier protein
MDLRKIKALIDLLDKSNLAELEIKEGEESVRLARHSTGQVMMAPQHMQMPQFSSGPAPGGRARHRAAAPGQPMPGGRRHRHRGAGRQERQGRAGRAT